MTDTSLLKIDDQEYALGKVILDVFDRAEADIELVFSLHTDTDDADHALTYFAPDKPTSHGFLLSSLSVKDVYSADDISGLRLDFHAISPHYKDPLGGCMIFETGRILYLKQLHIEFGQPNSDSIPVQFTAQCVCRGNPADTIQVTTGFIADVQIRRPYKNVADDLRKYYCEHDIEL